MSNPQQNPNQKPAQAPLLSSSPAAAPFTYEACMGREIVAVEFGDGVIAPGIADRVTSFNLNRPDHKNFEIVAGPQGICARLVRRATDEVDGFTVTTVTDSSRMVAWANIKAMMLRDIVTVTREPIAAKKPEAA